MNSNIISKKLVALGLSAATALAGGYLIVPMEGEVVTPDNKHIVYLDPVGIPTYCWGLTGKDMYGKTPVVGSTYTQDECITMFAQRLSTFEKSLSSLVKVSYKSPYQQAAFTSFEYNVGVGNLASSSLLREFNAGNHNRACDKLLDWVYAKKKKLNGLVNRRSVEKKWCMGEVSIDIENAYNELLPVLMEYEKDKHSK